ncbi:MAG: arginine--tRNA ligase [Acidimicrobiia bacterium]|nr:arginine--tRNA ligase [Acidimicrobiia bacterium]NNF09441.1 arginine--tRNA ligase [Acidimicrobiia bacterium]NNL70033.1 arginine--tRNA ligase [Acidimicrobiia bacterium]
MSLLSSLTDRFADAYQASGLERALGAVTVSDRPDLAQFQNNGALAAARGAGRPPRDIAADVIAAAGDPEVFSDLSVAGPGFINISLTDSYLGRHVDRLAADSRFGAVAHDPDRRVLIDFGGPNVAKAMHVGHLRSSLIGDSLQRVFRFAGYTVLSDIHFGDWGTQMGQLIIEAQLRKPDLPYFDPGFTGPYPEEPPFTLEDLQEMYPAVAARTKADPAEAERAREATLELQQGRPGYRALWQHFWNVSHDSQQRDFAQLGVGFDLWHGESTVHDRVAPMLERMQDVATEDAGALIIDVAEEADTKEVPPLLLTKSDGGYLYGTTDLATIDNRVAMKVDEALYVVDARQSLHFEQVFRAAYKAGIASQSMILEHVPFGTMNGPDGKPFKTREGGVLRLDDLIGLVRDAALARLDEAELATEYDEEERRDIAEKVGLAALKYGDLSNNRASNYVFDLDRFTAFEGKTGPYLLYGAVRIKSILRKAADADLVPGSIIAPTVDPERRLMLELSRFPEVIERTIESRAPNHLAEFAYDVVTAFNRFYEECHILSERDAERQASWLGLVELTLAMVSTLLDLLGIEIPERM